MQQSFQELWGYSRPVTFHGEGDLAKKKVQHKCRWVFVWGEHAGQQRHSEHLHLKALMRTHPLEYWVGRDCRSSPQHRICASAGTAGAKVCEEQSWSCL